MVNISSVGTYANRSYVQSPLKTQLSYFNVLMMEDTVYNELGDGITGMARIIPNVRKLIATFALQDENVDVNF